MTLPQIQLPVYDMKLPSSGKPIKVRPFVVKEEKLLLMAIEANDEKEIINTTKQIIHNCIIDGEVDVDKIPFFDIDYLFIALRAKSIGESMPVQYVCHNFKDDQECNSQFIANIDISNVELDKNPEIEDKIQLSGNIMVKMKYPNYVTMKTILDNDNIINKKVNIIIGSIEYIKEKNKFYTLKDLKRDDLKNFVENLTQEQYRKLEKYVDNFPSFLVKSKAKCPHCGFEHEIEYREFTSFFD